MGLCGQASTRCFYRQRNTPCSRAMEGPEQLSALQGNNLERLPLALLGDVLLRVAARNAFALSQASAKLRELVFAAGSTTHLWASLDVPALREEGCCSGQDLDASIALVLLQQRIPEGLRMFRGAATDAVLAALQKFAGTLESVSVSESTAQDGKP